MVTVVAVVTGVVSVALLGIGSTTLSILCTTLLGIGSTTLLVLRIPCGCWMIWLRSSTLLVSTL